MGRRLAASAAAAAAVAQGRAVAGGRPAVPDGNSLRAAPALPGRCCPPDLGCGSGSACWRRFRNWTAAGVWSKAHARLLAALGRRGMINLKRAVIDSASVRAEKRGRTPAPTPPTAAKRAANAMCSPRPAGCRWRSGSGRPTSGDETMVGPMLAAVPPIPGPRGGRPRRKPEVLQGDRGYGFPATIAEIRRLGIRPLVAERGSPHGSGLGKTRYVVERTLAWLGSPPPAETLL